MGDTEKSNKSNKNGDSNMNYMERMRRKWTKFKNDMGLKSTETKEKERNPKFMLLLKEVQQAKVDGDEDYMKTTKELGR